MTTNEYSMKMKKTYTLNNRCVSSPPSSCSLGSNSANWLRLPLLLLLGLILSSQVLSYATPASELPQASTVVPLSTAHVLIDAAVESPHLLAAAVAKQGGDATTFHLFSHGRPGQLLLNGQWLAKEDIARLVQQHLATNQQQPTTINIYGCNFAQGEAGKAAVSYLETALGIAVAASDDVTGVDGDWELEVGKTAHTPQFNTYTHNLQTCPGGTVGGTAPTDDFDGDGYCNNVDLDDDNDGILDLDEKNCTIITVENFENAPGVSNTNYDGFANAFPPGASQVVNSNGTSGYFENPVTVFGQIIAAEGSAYGGLHSNTLSNPNSGQEVIRVNLEPSEIINAGTTVGIRYQAYAMDLSGNAAAVYDKFSAPGHFDIFGIRVGTPNPTAAQQDNSNILSAVSGIDLLNRSELIDHFTSWEEYSFQFVANHNYDRLLIVPTNTLIATGTPLTPPAEIAFLGIDNIQYFNVCNDKDTDNDGFPDHLDPDSDNDGCPDAIEGAATNVTAANLNGSGQITGGVNANGVPTLVGSGQANTTAVTTAEQITVNTAPANQSVATGANATFSVNASSIRTTTFNSGTPNYGAGTNSSSSLIYKWYKNTAPNTTLSTSSTLTINNAQAANAGDYTVEITNTNNSCPTVRTATLTIGNPCTDGATVGVVTANDPDADGINNVCDLDDDNDGILDVDDGIVENCSIVNIGAPVNFNATLTGSPGGTIQTAATLNVIGGTSDGFTLDIYALDESWNLIINGTELGVGGSTASSGFQTQSTNRTVQFADGTYYGNGIIEQPYSPFPSNAVRMRMFVNANGTVELYGRKTETAPLELMVIRTTTPFGAPFSVVPFTWNNGSNNVIQVTQWINGQTLITGSVYAGDVVCTSTSIDTDNDGIPNHLDPDSDNDGCPDAIEGGGSFTAANIDGNNRLTGGVDANGVPTVAGASGQSVGTSTVATQVTVSTTPTDQAVAAGDPASFSAAATADNATSYSSGTPVYGTPGNANAGINYQWYIGDPTTTGTIINNGGVYTGAMAATLNISDATGLFGTQYCVLITHDDNPCIQEVNCATLNLSNNPPVAVDDAQSTSLNTAVIIAVLANDTDEDNNLDETSVTNTGLLAPTNGAISINNMTGAITYTPNTDFYGTDTFEYQVCDTDNECDVALVTITVMPDTEVNCTDGIDDDGDGLIDCDDPDCKPVMPVILKNN